MSKATDLLDEQTARLQNKMNDIETEEELESVVLREIEIRVNQIANAELIKEIKKMKSDLAEKERERLEREIALMNKMLENQGGFYMTPKSDETPDEPENKKKDYFVIGGVALGVLLLSALAYFVITDIEY